MGKYIKYYDTHSEYDGEKDLFDLPNVSWCEQEEDVHYTDEDFYRKQYLTFDIVSDGTLTWAIGGTGNYLSCNIYYSINNGITWTEISPSNDAFLNVTQGQKILFKGNNSTYCNSVYGNYNQGGYEYTNHCFGGTALFNAYGNIMSLINGDSFLVSNTLSSTHTFEKLFKDSKIVNAKNLILPALTLSSYCYADMFNDCKSLITVPVLPASILTQYCYAYMFFYCTSLTTAPELPATTLVTSCYEYMFCGCSKLNYIKALFKTTPSTTYTSNWVSGISSTGTFVKNPSATWTTTGVHGVPSGWTVVTADS